MSVLTNDDSEAAIFSRMIRPEQGDMSDDAARSILRLAFSQYDRDRMHALAQKGQQGTLTDAETRLIDSYCRLGHLLEMMQSKARLSLRRNP